MRTFTRLFGLGCGALVIAIAARYGFKTSDNDFDGALWAFTYGAVTLGGLFGHSLGVRACMSRLKRQQFLGTSCDAVLAAATIGLVGLGGGGSHVAQQLAHVGIGGFVLVDPDTIDYGNTNRLVGGTLADVKADAPKTEIAARQILGINPAARIIKVKDSWHDATVALKGCDIIMGGIDSFSERDQLERFARRHLILYIDIGMDVHDIDVNGFLIAGQVVLSSPGHPCLRCCGVVTEEKLSLEAQKYGAAGGRPQVVWPNGVLASMAVGLAVGLLTQWHRKHREFVFLTYDGNKGTVVPSPKMAMLAGFGCPHHPAAETGEPLFDIRKHLATAEQACLEDQDRGATPSTLWTRIKTWIWRSWNAD